MTKTPIVGFDGKPHVGEPGANRVMDETEQVGYCIQLPDGSFLNSNPNGAQSSGKIVCLNPATRGEAVMAIQYSTEEGVLSAALQLQKVSRSIGLARYDVKIVRLLKRTTYYGPEEYPEIQERLNKIVGED